MTRSTTKLGRAARAGVLTAAVAIVGVTTVMASATSARAWDRQGGEATEDDAINRQAAARGATIAARPGPYASARRDRGGETPSAPRKGFQDIK